MEVSRSKLGIGPGGCDASPQGVQRVVRVRRKIDESSERAKGAKRASVHGRGTEHQAQRIDTELVVIAIASGSLPKEQDIRPDTQQTSRDGQGTRYTYKKPRFRIGDSIAPPLVVEGSTGATGRSSTCLIIVKSTQNDDLFTGHKHEIFGFGGGIVNESRAGAYAALLKGEAGPCVECVCVHCNEAETCGRYSG